MAHDKGKKVDFRRNAAVTADNTSVVAVVKKGHASQVQQYVIEHEMGWNPDPLREKTYGLDKKKKYLFVSEAELSAPGTNKKEAAAAPAKKKKGK